MLIRRESAQGAAPVWFVAMATWSEIRAGLPEPCKLSLLRVWPGSCRYSSRRIQRRDVILCGSGLGTRTESLAPSPSKG
jgi:hypothetical protein